MLESYSKAFCDHLDLVKELHTNHLNLISEITNSLIETIQKGGKIFWCGNGGSAADSQHLAAELLGRFKTERKALPSLALNSDIAVLTAIGNDYGYEAVFARQVEGLMSPHDTLIGISTSGSSKNVIQAVRAAKKLGAKTIAFTRTGGLLKEECHLALCIPSQDTARIQEMHLLCGHMICEAVEKAFT